MSASAIARALAKVARADRSKLKKTAQSQLEDEAKKQGYSNVKNIELASMECDADWCTAAATGKASRVKKTEEGAGEE